MASLNSIQNSTTITVLFIITVTFLLHHLLCPVSCFNQPQHAPDPLCEEKSRLGSSPPTCYNKCNQCHPCMAVQVPSVPSHTQVHPCLVPVEGFFLQGNRYSNYKPLSWKCRCGDHYFNP
ncbi:hypothetical protein Fmac_013968 [Flemingia macrophylla]|uniref:Epidermal patterning factor-like protein n=1 Tax=Flemingia macrophylla TaxID=520843 RepID=A0ABD1MAG8_9FABA